MVSDLIQTTVRLTVRHCSPRLGWPVRLGLLTLGLGLAMVTPPPGIGWIAPIAQAQPLRPELRDPSLADPLLDTPRDPLLPTPPVPRPLSPLELVELGQALDQLRQEADALSAAGENAAAIPLWLREVRLRRLLGVDAELRAMDRLAPRLRDRSATEQLQLLALRLEVIQAELDLDTPADQARLPRVADTYVQLGQVQGAIPIYRQLADQAQAAGDLAGYQTQLETLARLQARQFAFAPAATAYGELVDLAQQQGQTDAEIRYLKAQIHNLEQGQTWPAVLETQQRLLALYTSDREQWPLIPPLQHQMGQAYRARGDLDTASRSYQAAYINAIDQGQFNVAAAAIRELADLYKTLARWADVRYLYEQLILVEQQAYSAYGVMDAFDQLGQVYEVTNDPAAAIAAYQEALVLARHLNHRQAYFEQQINRLMEEMT